MKQKNKIENRTARKPHTCFRTTLYVYILYAPFDHSSFSRYFLSRASEIFLFIFSQVCVRWRWPTWLSCKLNPYEKTYWKSGKSLNSARANTLKRRVKMNETYVMCLVFFFSYVLDFKVTCWMYVWMVFWNILRCKIEWIFFCVDILNLYSIYFILLVSKRFVHYITSL